MTVPRSIGTASRPRLASLAKRNVFVGTSSWKYQGWLNQIYTPSRYASRGKFSKQRFDAECISEYAEVFPAVCGDFAFYQFPEPGFWANLFRRVPPQFQFALKVPEQITRMEFSDLPRYSGRGGTESIVPRRRSPEIWVSRSAGALSQERQHLDS
jgi:uncharacterized protein YecE (DUF72 family)